MHHRVDQLLSPYAPHLDRGQLIALRHVLHLPRYPFSPPAPGGLNSGAVVFVLLGMWDDRRLVAALEALPSEALIEGPPDDGDLLWRRAVRRMGREAGGALAEQQLTDGHVAPVIDLPVGSAD